MNTYLFTWNPKKTEWSKEQIQENAELTAAGKTIKFRWSTGNRKSFSVGDLVFLLKQGTKPRGIVGIGRILDEEGYEDPHWADHNKTALYINVRWERILNSYKGQFLDLDAFKSKQLKEVYWSTPASGIMIDSDAAEELKQSWTEYLESL